MTENYLNKIQPIDSTYTIWKKMKPYIYKYLQRIHCSDIEDAYSESYFYIDAALSRYNPKRQMAFTSWIMSCLKQKLFNYCFIHKYIIRRPSYLKEKPDQLDNIYTFIGIGEGCQDEEKTKQLQSIDETYSNEFDFSKLKEVVREALNHINPRYRRITEMFYGIGMSRRYKLKEIASLYGISIAAVAAIINKTKKRLHQYLTRTNKYIGEILDYEA